MLQCPSEALSILFAEADLGVFSMFGRIGAPQNKKRAHTGQRMLDSSTTFFGLCEHMYGVLRHSFGAARQSLAYKYYKTSEFR